MTRSRPKTRRAGFWTGCGRGMPWFDHVMRAQQRYNDSKGDFYAAGITYFTIFALFPLLMVGFAAGGFVLASQPGPARRDREPDQGRPSAATSASRSSS